MLADVLMALAAHSWEMNAMQVVAMVCIDLNLCASANQTLNQTVEKLRAHACSFGRCTVYA